MSDYKKMPWSVEDTIDHMDQIRCSLIRRLKAVNLDGKAEQDVAELNFDFNRAIKAMQELQRYKQIGTVKECREAVTRQSVVYCKECKFYRQSLCCHPAITGVLPYKHPDDFCSRGKREGMEDI